MDPEYLAQLRANAAEVRADLESREHHQRLLEGDPQVQHDAIMEATRVVRTTVVPEVVYKTHDNAVVRQRTISNADDVPPFADDQIDVLAEVLVQLREELQTMVDAAVAPLREKIANLEGQISVLTALLGSDSGKSFEASETVRKLRVAP